MISLTALWLPILVSAIVVFLAGHVLNMLSPHHRNDFFAVGDEDGLRSFIHEQDLAEGQYYFPYAATPKAMRDPAWLQKLKDGPVGFLIIGPAGNRLAAQLAQQFVYVVVISIFVAYLASATLPAGVEYLKVFQVTGCAAFLGYAGATVPYAIWFRFTWSHTLKIIFDGFVYALLAAGVFGWLWPATV